MNRREQFEPPRNRLLASLSQDDYGRLGPMLEPVKVDYRQRIYDADKPIPAVYLLETGVA